ncbi:MAG: TonB-dependent receptor [Methylobacter sp.]|nr:TonB-dependent receptor [Methylobacter sp.]
MRRLITTLILLALSRSVTANDSDTEDLTNLSIEELLNVEVISSSRLGQKTNQAPTSVSILTASDIRTFGWRTLADALNGMRGLFTANDRNYSFLGVRGFEKNDYNSRVLMMIDGLRMNENIYDTGNIAQEFMLDIDLVERIEYIPGSGSTIYGANAFLGFINVITKKGKAINGAQLAGEAGSFDTYKGRVSYGKQFDNGTDILFSASHYDSGGVENLYFPAHDNPASNNGIAHNMDTERADRLFGKVQFEDFTFSGGVVDRYKQVPTASYGQVFNDPDNHSVDRQYFGNINYQKALNDKSSLLLKGFYQGYDYQAKDIYNFNDTRTVSIDKTVGRWFGGEAQITTNVFDRHRLIFGLEYQYDLRQYQVNYDVDPYYQYLNTNRNGHRVEVFAQDDIQILDDLVFSAGLRFDYHHQIQHLPVNPRLGLIWNPLSSTTFKLLYSSTFRAPNAAQMDANLYYFGVNSKLQEEKIKSYESIVEWHSSDGLKLFGSLFYNHMEKLLGYNSDGYVANIDHYDAYGAESEAEKRWDNGRLLKASYTFSFLSDQLKDGARTTGSPQNVFKLHYAEPLFNNYAKLGVENIYIGNRKTEQGNLADAYDLINVNLTSDRLMQGLDVSLGVYNLLDSHYQMLGGGVNNILLMNGREFRVKLQVTF